MKTILLTIICVLSAIVSGFGQIQQHQQPAQTSSGFDKSKIEIGGGFGFSFGSDYSSINISPQVGYAFNQYFSAGLGVGYNYYRYSRIDETLNYLGFNAYGRVRPIRYIALQVQPEIYGMWGSLRNESIESRTVPALLVGGGGIFPAGKGGMSVMIYYDVLQNDYSPYGNQLVYSVGYVFNF